MRDNDLREWFQRAKLIAQPEKRGRELESFTAALFRKDHFRVQLNPGSARPRQTDLIAIKVTNIYLVECKWRSDPANIDDIDSLRSRLGRTDTRAIGILLSFNGFTSEVVRDVEVRRSQPVLLISGDELEQVVSGWDSLSDLIWRKRQALLVDGKVLLNETPGQKKRRLVPLPHAEAELLWPDGNRTRMLECAGAFGQFLFTSDLPDIDWVAGAGHGVTLDIQPTVHNASVLIGRLETIANLGWSTPQSRWSIQQSRRNWHGWGAEEFASAIGKWRARAQSEGAHHSEEILYADVCDGGFYTIAAKIAAHRSQELSHINLSFQLQGMPLDPQPLLELCHTLGVHEHLYLRPRDTASVRRVHLDDDIYIRSPRALVVASEQEPEVMGPEQWVVGIVVDNPFRAGHRHLAEDMETELRTLDASELLVCALPEHHRLDEDEYGYQLVRLEYARSTDGLVLQAVARWDRVDV